MILWYSCFANTTFAFDRQDTLRGSNGRGRSWWDVQHYALSISFDTAAKSIHGSNLITAKIIAPPIDSLQLDLQELMFLDSVVMEGKQLDFVKEGNVWWIKHPFSKRDTGSRIEFLAYWHGKPRIAKSPPWDGGFIWTKDSLGNPWIAVACQGLGASSWWACKDYQGDEPDSGTRLSFRHPKRYPILGQENRIFQVLIANGRIVYLKLRDKENRVYNVPPIHPEYDIQNPINTYNTTFYIGDYISWTDTLMGEKGTLDLSFHALHYNEEKARRQFAITKDMLHCFEYWMGPYPFYEDGYKLVEAPYLGMEHQSAIAYGNEYKMGYRGADRSGTGVGLLFDYIIVHESGHEWFGNNITAQDIADNWLHEGFTTYSEALFVECAFGKEKAYEFTRGEWKNIRNDRNIIGNYGVNDDGSSDRYDKGSAVVHMIRTIMNDDEKFRQLLRGLNKDFYHKIVTTAQIEAYINDFTKYNFTPVFNQYLRTTNIPAFDYYIKKKRLFFRFKDVVEGFTLPLTITGEDQTTIISPTSEWQSIKWKGGYGFEVSKDFLIRQ